MLVAVFAGSWLVSVSVSVSVSVRLVCDGLLDDVADVVIHLHN